MPAWPSRHRRAAGPRTLAVPRGGSAECETQAGWQGPARWEAGQSRGQSWAVWAGWPRSRTLGGRVWGTPGNLVRLCVQFWAWAGFPQSP